jgi:hypothetical protein
MTDQVLPPTPQTAEVYQTNYEKWIARDRELNPSRTVEDLELRIYLLNKHIREAKLLAFYHELELKQMHREDIQSYHNFSLELLDREPGSQDALRSWLTTEITNIDHVLKGKI